MSKDQLTLALIGKDVSKSLSEKFHRFILGEWGISCNYERFSVRAEDFDSAMRRLLGDFDGFNVTIPYKRDVFEYLDGIEGDALACGAVNTVLCDTRQGYNTDGVGFMLMLESSSVRVKGKKILVLGAGGAGRSTAVALKNAGAEVELYRRNKAELEEACAQLGVNASRNPEGGGYDIVVNCTGVGMHETEGQSPVDKTAFKGAKWAVDLIYEPEKSAFLSIAENQAVRILNGKSMLFYQAYYADCLYLNKSASVQEAKTLYEKYLAKGE
ncbi:MAG: shikimate dehydrogenase [Clostridiales bacterium]|nr:shikimate dehydrogenase [Clostridiales bacterium]